MSAKTDSGKRAARACQLKKRIREIVDRHRASAFAEGLDIAVKDHPKGYSYVR